MKLGSPFKKQLNPRAILLLTALALFVSFFPLYCFPPLLHPFRYISTILSSYSPSPFHSSSPPWPFAPPPPSLPSSPDQSDQFDPLPLQSPSPPLPAFLRPPPPPPALLHPSPLPSILSGHSPPAPPPPRPRLPPPPPLPPTKPCDLWRGEWVRDADAAHYTNTTCWMIQEHQNCMKYGRPDTDYLKWRWKPEGCDLPAFDPERFLELVRNKSMAFVGDSLARNQMQSLMCLLSRVEYPEDVSYTSDDNFKRMFYKSYNFTIWIFWSPFLVRAEDPAKDRGPMGPWNLHLDQADPTWTGHIDKFDFVLISGGNWFTRPSMYHEKNTLIGCNYCRTTRRVRRITLFDANRKAFRTAFTAINKAAPASYKGVTFLRTLSPSHYENGTWNEGGDCRRTRPIRRSNTAKLASDELRLYRDQVEEFEEAGKAARKKGLKFVILDVTGAMLLRPDGHPSRYGHWPEANVTLYNDCVHWCLPGPIDLWNDILFQSVSM